jgi:hypothetical protein
MSFLRHLRELCIERDRLFAELPRSVAEPTTLSHFVVGPTTLSHATLEPTWLGRIRTPQRVTAHGIAAACEPYATPRSGAFIRLTRLDSFDDDDDIQAEALAFLVSQIVLVAELDGQALCFSVRASAQQLRVALIHISIPDGVCCPTRILVSEFRIAGNQVRINEANVPFSIQVVAGMCSAPISTSRLVVGSSLTPAVAGDGTFYFPKDSQLLIFGCNGHELVPLGLEDKGFVGGTRDSARAVALVEQAGVLLISSNIIVAVARTTRELMWSIDLSSMCRGIAVLPSHGVVVAPTYLDDKLNVITLSNGRTLYTAHERNPTFAVGHDDSASVFVSSTNSVVHYKWTAKKRFDGTIRSGTLALVGAVEVAKACDWRPLAVVPPSCGLPACLVVGVFGKATLEVVSLLDFSVIHTHSLQSEGGSVNVNGLVACPSGAALAVCDDSTGSVLVLAWPLPGML